MVPLTEMGIMAGARLGNINSLTGSYRFDNFFLNSVLALPLGNIFLQHTGNGYGICYGRGGDGCVATSGTILLKLLGL